MKKIDLTKFQGQKLNSVINEAEKLEKNSLEGMINAHKIFSSCIAKVSSDYNKGEYSLRGFLRKKIWDIERHLGWNDQFFSQAGQDKFIMEEFFKYQNSGFFIEVGAYNGVVGSNCLHFEKFKKWQGIAIEPSPLQFKSLKKNRSCLTINKALSVKNGAANFFDITSGLTQMSGLNEHYDQKRYEQIKKDKKNKISEIEVETISLDTLISAFNVKEIDYCSIDIEGGEMSIIEKFDFSKYPIKVISIENREPNENQYNVILEKQNYKFLDCVGVDEIWYNHKYFNFFP